MSDSRSDAARETPETAGSVTDSSSGHGRHRGPSAPPEDTQAAAPGPGRHRRNPGDGQEG